MSIPPNLYPNTFPGCAARAGQGESPIPTRAAFRREICFAEAIADFAWLLTSQSRHPLAPFESICMGRWNARWGARTLAGLPSSEVQAYFAELAQKGVQLRDIQAEKSLLSSLYRWAAASGWASQDPTSTLERTRTLLRQPSICWTHHEQRRLLDSCLRREPYLRPLVLIGLRTGLRFGHLLNLEWRHVSLTRGKITIPATEVAAGRAIEISIDVDTRSVLEELIQLACKASCTGKRVFAAVGLPLWRGRPDHHAVLSAFRNARRQAGIVEGGFDSLRLTFARNCAKACVPISYPLSVGDWDEPELVQKVYEDVQRGRLGSTFRKR